MTKSSLLLRSATALVVSVLQSAHALKCVRLQKYEDPNCVGQVVQTMTFPTWETPGSPCFPYTLPASDEPSYRVWIQDQYCNADGAFQQMVYSEPDCQGENVERQVFTTDTCLHNRKLESPCTDGTVTLLKFKDYDTDCSGEVVERITFTVSLDPGSACFQFDGPANKEPVVLYMKDQYCDEGVFKQTLFDTSDTCHGGDDGVQQEFSVDSCMFGYKLAEPCRYDAVCLDSNGAMFLGVTLASLLVASVVLINYCGCCGRKKKEKNVPVPDNSTTKDEHKHGYKLVSQDAS